MGFIKESSVKDIEAIGSVCLHCCKLGGLLLLWVWGLCCSSKRKSTISYCNYLTPNYSRGIVQVNGENELWGKNVTEKKQQDTELRHY